MTEVQSTYLALLRKAVGLCPNDGEGESIHHFSISDSAQWSELLHLCAIQGTAPLVYNQLLLLSPSQTPDLMPGLTDDMRIQLKQHCLSNMLNQQRLQSILTTVWSALQHPAEGEPVHPVLLKGFGLAQLYPQPYLRSWGDLDVYVGPAQYHRAAALLRDAFPQAKHHDEEWEELKHYNFVLPSGDSIEMHRITIAFLSRRDQAYYQRLEDEAMKSAACNVERLTMNDERVTLNEGYHSPLVPRANTQQSSIQIGDLNCALPEPQFNLLFVFLHAWNHFVYEGVGFKQLCDLALLARMLRMNDERLTCNDERLTINDERLTNNDERLTMNDERLTMNDERLTINNERLTNNDERLTNNDERLTINDERPDRVLTSNEGRSMSVSAQSISAYLRKPLHHLHLWEPWQLMGYVLVHSLNLSSADWPLYHETRRIRKYGERLQERILTEGQARKKDYGDSKDRYEAREKALKMNVIARKWLTLKGKIATAHEIAPYCPRYACYLAYTEIMRGVRRTLRGEKMEVMY